MPLCFSALLALLCEILGAIYLWIGSPCSIWPNSRRSARFCRRFAESIRFWKPMRPMAGEAQGRCHALPPFTNCALSHGQWPLLVRSREKVKPSAELERAKSKIEEFKESIRQSMKVSHCHGCWFQSIRRRGLDAVHSPAQIMDESGGERAIDSSLYDSDGELSAELIFCAKCHKYDVRPDSTLAYLSIRYAVMMRRRCLNVLDVAVD